jgi:hypothetical protein
VITILGLAAITAICAYVFFLLWQKTRFWAAPWAGATIFAFAMTLIWASDSVGFSDIVKSDVERRMAEDAGEANQ